MSVITLIKSLEKCVFDVFEVQLKVQTEKRIVLTNEKYGKKSRKILKMFSLGKLRNHQGNGNEGHLMVSIIATIDASAIF